MRLSRMHFFSGCVLAVTLCWFLYPSTTLADDILPCDYDCEIDVAPNVLNIQSESVVVTVHTDIAYSRVDGSRVFLSLETPGIFPNDYVEIYYGKSDAQGNFVAKFLSDEIKTLDGLIIGDYNTFVFTGCDKTDLVFCGKQDILVNDNIPEGKN